MATEHGQNCGGCYVVSEGTLRVQDLIAAYLDELDRFTPARASSLRIDVQTMKDEYGEEKWAETDEAAETLATLTDALERVAPWGHYFGTLEGDGACFGFWATDGED